jgi:uncharacterized protein YndB with AHSA1/START domain
VALEVIGAGVGRTGTTSLKIALERLLGRPCHHMYEMFVDPTEIPRWTDAIDGCPVDWTTMCSGYAAVVDWPGAAFWPELTIANPDALVVLSVRDAESWYRSAMNTIFQVYDIVPPEMRPWFESMRRLLDQRFSCDFRDPDAMMTAFELHNESVRRTIPPGRLLEWSPGDGWGPLCDRLGLDEPTDPFPRANDTNQWRELVGMAPIA